MKKVLSIVLSIVMVLCMMPAMAFAGTADFTDAADINHDAAVDTLVALGIFEGYPDGSFQPAKVVTRAEMAKTIATVLNGGKAPVLSASTTSYTDTKGHWAAPYIEYCTSLGIVEGVGAGAFAPDAPVTAEAAAKMILVAQGYNATVEGMTGAAWASNTNVLANQNGYYAELTDIATDAGCAREHVAQMINNALAAGVVVQEKSVNKATGEVVVAYVPTATTMGAKYFGYATTATSEVLAKVVYNTTTKKFDYDLGTAGTVDFSSKTDYSALFGQAVKVLFKDANENGTLQSTEEVVGVVSVDSTVVATGVYGDITFNATTDVVTIGGVDYKIDDADNVSYLAEFTGSTATPAKYEAIKAIDNDGDDKIDVITYAPVVVEQVEFIGTKKINTSGVNDYTVENTIYTGVAVDDYVAVTTDLATGKTVLTKLELIENVKVESNKGTTYVIGGVSYKLNDRVEVALDSSYDIVAINGYVVVANPVSTTADVANYAIVLNAETTRSTGYNTTATHTVTLFKTDGTTVTVPAAQAYEENTYEGNLVKFTVNAKGQYEIALASGVNTNTALTKTATNTFVAANTTEKTPATVGGKRIADDAVIFVVAEKEDTTNGGSNNKTFTCSTITGAELAAKNTATVAEAYTKVNANGFATVALAKITASALESKTVYAYVTDSIEFKADGSAVVTLSTGTFNIAKDDTANLKSGGAAAFVKGDIVSYEFDGTKFTSISEVNLSRYKYAVKNYEDGYIVFHHANTEYKLAKDATIIYVDSAAQTVATTGQIVKASCNEANDPVANVACSLGSSTISLIVVDVNNDLSAL